MSRVESSTNQTELDRADVSLCFAVDMDFPDGMVRLNDSACAIPFGGYTYTGKKLVVSSDVQEGIEVVSRPISLSISGVDSDLIDTVRAGGYQAREVVLYLCLFTAGTLTVVDTPETVWLGFMDTCRIKLSKGSGVIDINCEHILRSSPQAARYTDVDQQALHSGDRFFDQVPKIAGYVGRWGENTLLPKIIERVRRAFPGLGS